VKFSKLKKIINRVKDDLEKEILQIKHQKNSLNLTKNDLIKLSDKSPLQVIIDSIYSQDLLANTEMGRQIMRLDSSNMVEKAKNVLNVLFILSFSFF
jgi:hypothetical protein